MNTDCPFKMFNSILIFKNIIIGFRQNLNEQQDWVTQRTFYQGSQTNFLILRS